MRIEEGTRKINIIITLIDLHFGGISNLVLQSTPELTKKFNVTIVYFGPNRDMLSRYEDAGLMVHRIAYNGGKDLMKTALELAKYIRVNNIKVVATNFLPDKIIVSVARILTKFKIIATIHNSYNPQITSLKNKGIKYNFEEIFHNKIANKVIAVSNAALKNAIKFRNLKNSDIRVIHSGINPLSDRFNHNTINDNLPVQFVTTCRIVPMKGLERLIDCLNDSKIKNKSWIFKIVGEGEEKEKLKEKVLKLGLNSKILFLGYRDDVKSILKESHFYINSSFNEALGISLIEAMSLGLPLIGSNVGGIPEVIEEYRNGYLIDFNNHNEAREKILKAINLKAEDYKKLSRNSYEIFHRKFSVRKYVDEIEKEIGQLINMKK